MSGNRLTWVFWSLMGERETKEKHVRIDRVSCGGIVKLSFGSNQLTCDSILLVSPIDSDNASSAGWEKRSMLWLQPINLTDNRHSVFFLRLLMLQSVGLCISAADSMKWETS